MKRKNREMIEVSVDELIPYQKNAKKHDDKQVTEIANSIKRFGFVQPVVVDKENVVVIGHGRLMAAKRLGLEKVPCIRAEDLSQKEIKALRLADNKLNESPWDFSLLNTELLDLDGFQMADFGFDFSFDYDKGNESQNQWANSASGGNDGDTGQGQGGSDSRPQVPVEGHEIDIDDFSDDKFRCKCPRCGFAFNPEG